MFLELLIMHYPSENAIYLLGINRSPDRATAAQGCAQIPERTMPLATSALAAGLAARHVAFPQGPPQRFCRRRQQLDQSLPSPLQCQFGESPQPAAFRHLMERL